MSIQHVLRATGAHRRDRRSAWLSVFDEFGNARADQIAAQLKISAWGKAS